MNTTPRHAAFGMLALASFLACTPAQASITANATISNMTWQVEKIDSSLPGQVGVSTLSNDGTTGLVWTWANPGENLVQVPGSSQHMEAGFAPDGMTYTFAPSVRFDNGVNGITLSGGATSTPGLYEQPDDPNTYYISSQRIISNIDYNGSIFQPIQGGLRLTANSRLTITASSSGNIAFDANDIDADPNTIVLGADISNMMQAYVVPDGMTYFQAIFSDDENQFFRQDASLAFDPTTGIRTGSTTLEPQTFSLTVNNTSNTDTWVYFMAMTDVTVNQFLTTPPIPQDPGQPPITPSIPEPQTWATMCLGMAAIALARKRRRMQHQAAR